MKDKTIKLLEENIEYLHDLRVGKKFFLKNVCLAAPGLSCGAGLSCCTECGILVPRAGFEPASPALWDSSSSSRVPLHREADSQTLDHQGIPHRVLKERTQSYL